MMENLNYLRMHSCLRHPLKTNSIEESSTKSIETNVSIKFVQDNDAVNLQLTFIETEMSHRWPSDTILFPNFITIYTFDLYLPLGVHCESEDIKMCALITKSLNFFESSFRSLVASVIFFFEMNGSRGLSRNTQTYTNRWQWAINFPFKYSVRRCTTQSRQFIESKRIQFLRTTNKILHAYTRMYINRFVRKTRTKQTAETNCVCCTKNQ